MLVLPRPVARTLTEEECRRRLVYWGTRGQDAEPLLDIPQFEELFSLIAPLDSLKAKAESYGKSRDSRFFRYLEKIDEKQETVSSRVEAAETSGDAAWGEIRDGLKEAQQRLAIAKLAARSRFH